MLSTPNTDPKVQQTKMLVTCQGFGDFYLGQSGNILPIKTNIIKVTSDLKSMAKGDFFSESGMCFSNLQNKIIFQNTILNLKFKFFANNRIGGKFKFQAQDSFLAYFHFGDLEI